MHSVCKHVTVSVCLGLLTINSDPCYGELEN